MPRIPQQYLDCSIYLYDSKNSAESGEDFGGSGCLVFVTSNPIYDPASFKDGRYTKVSLHFPPHIYAVTNKHVIEKGYSVIRLNTVDGNTGVLELDCSDWIPHPDGDDLVVAPIDLPTAKHHYHPISVNSFVHHNKFNEYVGYYGIPSSAIGAGDDTFMVGRFISHDGKQRNTPSLRFGSIAMLPFEKIKLESGYMQEAYLVETRSISGYSGSPVFVYRPVEQKTIIPADYSNPSEGEIHSKSIAQLMGYPSLLGIDCGHIRYFDDVLDASGKPHLLGWKVESNTGMAIVIPAWRLDDLLNVEELALQRKQKDEEYKKKKEAEK